MNLHLTRKSGQYYIETDYDSIPIEPWEAAKIASDHDYVYEVIIAHKRKCNFNTAEDSPDSIL